MKKHKLKIILALNEDGLGPNLLFRCEHCNKTVFIDPDVRKKLAAGDASPFSRMHNTEAWWQTFTRWQRCEK